MIIPIVVVVVVVVVVVAAAAVVEAPAISAAAVATGAYVGTAAVAGYAVAKVYGGQIYDGVGNAYTGAKNFVYGTSEAPPAMAVAQQIMGAAMGGAEAANPLINVLGPAASFGDLVNRETLGAGTDVFRVQDPALTLAPHDSQFFEPSHYGLEGSASDYEALYLSSDRAALEKLRAGQGYFDEGAVTHQSTLGQVLGDAGKGATVVQDQKFNDTVVGRDQGGYIVVRRKDGTELPQAGRDYNADEIAARDAEAQRVQARDQATTDRATVSAGATEATGVQKDSRAIAADLRAQGLDGAADNVRDASRPLAFGNKETRLVKQADLPSAADQLEASETIRAAANGATPETATKLGSLADRIDAITSRWAP